MEYISNSATDTTQSASENRLIAINAFPKSNAPNLFRVKPINPNSWRACKGGELIYFKATFRSKMPDSLRGCNHSTSNGAALLTIYTYSCWRAL